MKYITKRLSFLAAVLLPLLLHSQSHIYLRGDTTVIQRPGGNNELKLENKTRDSGGVLINLGKGLTEFRRPKKINDSMLAIGKDTVSVGSGAKGFLSWDNTPLFDSLTRLKPGPEARNKSINQNWNGLGMLDTRIVTDSTIYHSLSARVVGVKSAAELRTITTVTAPDTQFVFRITNYTGKFTQDYQYDPYDAVSTDNGATIIVAGTKRYRAVFNEGIINVKLFGAKGDNITDDHDPIQAACDAITANIRLPRNLYFPRGVYRIYSPIIIYRWSGTEYLQCTVNLIGQEAAHFNSTEWEARIQYMGTDKFAIGVHIGRSMVIKGLSIEGPFNPPGPGDWYEYYLRPYATWASNYGVRDSPQSPLCGIVLDPFSNSASLIPADGGYPGMTSWYRGTGSGGGSSAINIRECRIFGFTVGVGISTSSETQNCDNIIIEKCTIEICKVAVASGQRQTKNNFIRQCISWDRVHTLISGDYGNGHGTLPNIDGWNVAGSVIQIVKGDAQFPLLIQNIFAEALYRIGDLDAGAGTAVWISNNLDFNALTRPYPIPLNHFNGTNNEFYNCTIRIYDDSANRRPFIKGSGNLFNHCWFDKIPLAQMDRVSPDPTIIYKDCRTFNNEIIGTQTIQARDNPGSYKLVDYGDITVRDGGQMTVEGTGIRDLLMHFSSGGPQHYRPIGPTAITIDSLQRKATITLAVGTSHLIAAGDYLLYGSGYDSLFGRILAVNYTTGVVNIIDVPIQVRSGTFDLVSTWYNIIRGYGIFDATNGSATFPGKFGNIFGPPVVGDRAKIGYPESIITAVTGSDFTTTEPSYYTRVGDYRPLTIGSERIEMTSYYDPAHSNLDGYTQLIPKGTIWKIWTSPYTNVQHTYIFTKGGYLHPTTFGQTLQAEWRLTADNNPDAFNIYENKNVNIGFTSDQGQKFQVNGSVRIDLGSDARGDILYRNASNAIARLAIGGANTVLHGGTDPSYSAVVEGDLSTSDITTANVTTSKHGFVPKAPSDVTKFLDGTGAWSVPAFSSGVYTPTLTNTTNISASTAFQCQWLKVGSVVHVSGKVTFTITAGASATLLGISLPVASGFAATGDAAGAAFSDVTQTGAALVADVVNSRVSLKQFSNGTGSQTFWFTFTYYLSPP